MKFSFLFSVALVLTLTTSALAQRTDWALLANTEGGGQIYVSPSSYLVRNNGNVSFSAKYVVPDSQRRAGSPSQSISRYTANCSDEWLVNYGNGQVQIEQSVSVAEGTVGRALLDWACSAN